MSERIVVLGGGFAGAFAAKYLRKYMASGTSIELINSDNYFVFQPLLPEVASGTINAPDAVTPLRQLLPGVKVRMATATGVDRNKQLVHFLQGSGRIPQSIAYDHLVVAVGQQTNQALVPGFTEHSLCIRDLADAHELRNKIIRRLEHADVTEDPVLKRRLLTFVVAGGGFSGVETIGEVVEMIRRTLRFYPKIDSAEIQAILVQSGDHILPELPAKLGEYAAKILRRRNVDIRLGLRVASATADAVYLSDGSRIETCLLVTTVGSGPREITQRLGINLEHGKIPVDEFLRAQGAKNIWALGDAASIPLTDARNKDANDTQRFAPPTAQFAVKEARCVAKNLRAAQKGESPVAFRYVPRGALASIGNYKGVAEVFGVSFSGLFAWLTWRALYIGMLPGFSTRLRVALNWSFDYFLPRSIVQIANRESGGAVTRRFAAGDIICGPGQRVDGFYTVLSGSLESRIPLGDGQEDFVRILGEGDHWGERSLTTDALTQGTLKATEDAQVLVLAADDFRQLRNAFPALDEYLHGISDKIYAPPLRRDQEL